MRHRVWSVVACSQLFFLKFLLLLDFFNLALSYNLIIFAVEGHFCCFWFLRRPSPYQFDRICNQQKQRRWARQWGILFLCRFGMNFKHLAWFLYWIPGNPTSLTPVLSSTSSPHPCSAPPKENFKKPKQTKASKQTKQTKTTAAIKQTNKQKPLLTPPSFPPFHQWGIFLI